MSLGSDTLKLTLTAIAVIIFHGLLYLFIEVLSGGKMEYLSVTETSKKWNIDRRWIQRLCKSNRIPGAIMIGNTWAIPSDAIKPVDQRIKSGRYIKQKQEG